MVSYRFSFELEMKNTNTGFLAKNNAFTSLQPSFLIQIRNHRCLIQNPHSEIEMKLFYLIALFCSVSALMAQSTGLILDDAEYAATPKVADFQTYGSKFGEAPTQYSLKKYCPTPNRQGDAFSCVFQSISYGAMTMMYAIQNNIKEQTQINAVAFSAMYGFNQVKSTCDSGVKFKISFELLQTKGSPPFVHFDQNNLDNCNKMPTATDHRKAAPYKIKSNGILFNKNDNAQRKQLMIQTALLANTPVIVGMIMPNDFKNYKGVKATSAYYESTGTPNEPHAMVIVGYDEYSFEIMNSWGTQWGKNGFFKIKYDDFNNLAQVAYQIEFEKREKTLPNPTITELKGHFEFRTPSQGAMQPINFVLTEGKYYTTTTKSYLGQQFQLAALELQKGKYIYVFSHDPQGVVKLHWPKLGESALVPYDSTYFLMPGAKRAFTKDKEGTDYLWVLYSNKELIYNDLIERLKQMESADFKTMPVLDKFEQAFQGILLERSKVEYDPMKPLFKAPVSDKIVPLILRVDTK